MRSAGLGGSVSLSVTTLVMASAVSASAGPFTTTPLVQVSGASPIAGCQGDDGNIGGTNVRNSEVEPFVAVDPSNPSVMIGAWQQDRWSNGGSQGLVSATSINGGASWTVNAADQVVEVHRRNASERRLLRAGLRSVDRDLPERDRVPVQPVSGYQPGRVPHLTQRRAGDALHRPRGLVVGPGHAAPGRQP